jgi:hypothetical protein
MFVELLDTVSQVIIILRPTGKGQGDGIGTL